MVLPLVPVVVVVWCQLVSKAKMAGLGPLAKIGLQRSMPSFSAPTDYNEANEIHASTHHAQAQATAFATSSSSCLPPPPPSFVALLVLPAPSFPRLDAILAWVPRSRLSSSRRYVRLRTVN